MTKRMQPIADYSSRYIVHGDGEVAVTNELVMTAEKLPELPRIGDEPGHAPGI